MLADTHPYYIQKERREALLAGQQRLLADCARCESDSVFVQLLIRTLGPLHDKHTDVVEPSKLAAQKRKQQRDAQAPKASGIDGLIRNLTAGEILGEILEVNRDEGATADKRAVTNVVLMGSGEPLDNYDEVTKFLRLLNDKDGINVSERNVSLSTCGITDKIRKLADDGFSVTLTISLHAPTDEIRKTIMPTANKYKIADILDAAKYYFDKTGRRYIFEYALIKGVNDGKENMLTLAKVLKGKPCHVNLIRLNYVKEKGLRGADDAEEMKKILEENGISATVRRTMGSDIDGACGQLRRRYVND